MGTVRGQTDGGRRLCDAIPLRHSNYSKRHPIHVYSILRIMLVGEEMGFTLRMYRHLSRYLCIYSTEYSTRKTSLRTNAEWLPKIKNALR